MNSDKKEIALIVCPHCKQKVPKTKWCITCGGEIVSTLINDTQQETVRIKCHNCQENVPALPFCVHCGQALNKPVEPKQKLCPLCRQEIPVSDHAFCHLCGAQLKTSVQTSSETVICNHCWKPNPPNIGNCIHCAKLLSRKPRKTVLLEEPFDGYQLELSQLLKPTTVPLSIIKQEVTSNFPTKSTILHSPYFGVVVKSRQTLSFLDKNLGGFNRENIMNYAGSFVIVLMLYFYWYSKYFSSLVYFETILSGVDPIINAIIVFIAGIILTSLLMMPLWLATFFVYRRNGYHLNYRLDTSRVLITMIFNFIWILLLSGGAGPIILRIGDIRKTEDRAIKNSSFVKGITMGSLITIVFTLFLTAITVLTFGLFGTFSGLVLHDHILKVHVAAIFFGGTWISLMLILPLGDFYDRVMKQYNMVLYFIMFIIAILMLLYSSEVSSVIDPIVRT